jgi:ABC-2 type transport system ATP-binding protein
MAKKRVKEVLEEIDLLEVANKRIQSFSKGMKQRIKLGQALIHRPKFIIADEPFNGLDPIVRKHIFDIMTLYSKEYETTWFISSHVLFEVERLAENIVLLYKGRTIAQGPPLRIRTMIQEQPHSIQITSKSVKNLVNLLLDQNDYNELISSIEFNPTTIDQKDTFRIETKEPIRLYQLITDLVVENNIQISEIKATEEGLENLFKTLTVG